MPVGARGILGTALLMGLALGALPAGAQETTPASRGWTDPPQRGAAPAARDAAPAKQVETPAAAPEPAKAASAKAVETAPGPVAARRADVRTAAHREPRQARIVAEARPRRSAGRPHIVTREAVRPRRVAAGRAAPRFVEAQPYALPVGRVMGFDGGRMPAFDDDRANRLAAAQAAGYLLVRARSVQFPDGRVLRTYRPYEDDGLED